MSSKNSFVEFLSQSLQSFQNNVRQAGPAASASYSLIGAVLFLGGLGFVIDRWLDTLPAFLLGGLFLGLIVGFYELGKLLLKK